MLMTGKLATKMRCCGPMPCGKHDPKDPPSRMCIGANCMAWRIAPHQDWISSGEATGWCGYAGEPQ